MEGGPQEGRLQHLSHDIQNVGATLSRSWKQFRTNVKLPARFPAAHFSEAPRNLLNSCRRFVEQVEGEFKKRHENFERHLGLLQENFGRQSRTLLSRKNNFPGQLMLASMSSHFGNNSFYSAATSTAAFTVAMTTEQVSKRLDGVPVYTVSNASNEFVLVSDLNSQKSLGIFCFRHEDAEALLLQVKDREPGLDRGARVVAVSLDKVYQLTAEGIAFRFLPDPHQVKNALETRAKVGDPGRAFDGVPVFQSDNLILRSNNRRFCPIFFCKEDLERALRKAFKAQQRINPSMRVNTEIQVGSFEDVMKRMESSEEDSGWGDIVFIPPGMDAMNHLGRAMASQGTVLARVGTGGGSSASALC